MPDNKGTSTESLRIYIPPHMPKLIPVVSVGMPPLPFSRKEPFTQAKIKPEGGAVNATPVTIRGASVGGDLAVRPEKGTKRNRRSGVKTNKLSVGVKTPNTKSQKGQSKKGNKRQLVRGNNGKFVKGGK